MMTVRRYSGSEPGVECRAERHGDVAATVSESQIRLGVVERRSDVVTGHHGTELSRSLRGYADIDIVVFHVDD